MNTDRYIGIQISIISNAGREGACTTSSCQETNVQLKRFRNLINPDDSGYKTKCAFVEASFTFVCVSMRVSGRWSFNVLVV